LNPAWKIELVDKNTLVTTVTTLFHGKAA
jgi:hypothetical protein